MSSGIRYVPWQWRRALVVLGVEVDQGGGGFRICSRVGKSEEVQKQNRKRAGEREGRLTSAAERIGVGESFVEIRPCPPEDVVRLQRRSLSGGGGHRVGHQVGEYSFKSAICILVPKVVLFLDESARFLLFPGDETFVP